MARWGLIGLVLAALGCRTITPSALQAPAALNNAQPEAATGFRTTTAVLAKHWMVAAANPLASQAAAQVLRSGGTAIDAALAAQLVLGLVEPQSSGIGGGAFILYFNAKTQRLFAMDGRETAPQAATDALFLNPQGTPLGFHDAVVGGRAVGVPGTVAALQALHRDHGTRPWADLFEPAIALAETGFAVSPRLHGLLRLDPFLKRDPQAAAYFYEPNGEPRSVGYILRNPELAQSLRELALRGADALRTGPLAEAIVRKVRTHPTNPGVLSANDLQDYQPRLREPLCGPYLRYLICGMPPPSSGTVAVLQILQQLEVLTQRYGPAPLTDSAGQLQAGGVHRLTEASRLAFADRGAYIADPDFVAWPRGLLAPGYIESRALQIHDLRSMGRADPGVPADLKTAWIVGLDREEHGTSHVSIVDAQGNAVSMTTTIEDAFGARQWVGGFLLNNQLTDFSFAPRNATGLVANRVEPGKRPRSSMTPLLVFDKQADGSRGALLMSIGSPGGSQIINYVAKTLVASLQDGLDIQWAISLPNVGSRNGPTELEKERAPAWLDAALAARGHTLVRLDMTSGIQGIMRTCTASACQWVGGADPRREGKVMGQ